MKLVPPLLLFPTCSKLTGVDGTFLKVHGHFQAAVRVKGLRREFKVNFIATETRPILGADFLTQYGLRLDMKNRQLTDPLANISVSLVSSDEPECTIRLAEEVRSDSFISKHCPSLLTAPDYSMVPNDVTEHCIETDG